MKLGVIADDFTGASDIALTLAEAGFAAVQYVGVPTAEAGDEDVAIIALKTRSVRAADAIAQSLAACEWLLAQGATQIVFKVCSTFDSTDQGNIGPVAEALADRLGESNVVVCPAFPENGRSVYMGHLFVGDRLLNESGMENHPLTPMRDADLRRVLARQSQRPVPHVAHAIVSQGAVALSAAIKARPGLIIVDAIDEADLRTIGQAVIDRKLMVGGSGIALGLPGNFGAKARSVSWTPQPGKGAVLSGSCSRATRGQIEFYKTRAPSRQIAPEEILGGLDLDAIADWAVKQDTAPLIYSSADPESVRAAQAKHGEALLADAIEAAFSQLAAALVRRGVSRIVVAGGETSGAVVSGIGATALEIGPRLAAGVPAIRVRGKNLALALKSGNFGAEDFFETALKAMEAS